MEEFMGNLWAYPCDALCVTTNGILKADGTLVMGAGVAKEAARRYPKLPALAGAKVRAYGNHVYVFNFPDRGGDKYVVTFPTKRDWREPSRLALIEASARRLVQAADHFGWKTVAMTRPGCGLGGLRWDDVRKVIGPILDRRFVVLTPSRQ